MISTEGYRKDISTEDILARISKGETIYSIAKSYDVSIPTIKYRINKAKKLETFLSEHSIEKIGIVVAVSKEILPFLDIVGDYSVSQIDNHNIYTFRNYPEITAIVAGVGDVQAAIATTVLVTEFKVDRIINLGFAETNSNKHNVGDLILVDKVALHENSYNNNIDVDSAFWENIINNKMRLVADEKEIDSTDCIIDRHGVGVAITCCKMNLPFSIIKCINKTPEQAYEDNIEQSQLGIEECAEKLVELIVTRRKA